MPNRKTILIVDDSAVIRKLLEETLHDEYNVITAQNGAEALDLLDSNAVTAIILDLTMPVMDGFEFLNIFSKRAENGSVPVIVVTDNKDKNVEIKALKAGAWDIVLKPFVPEIVKIRLGNAILRIQYSSFKELKRRSEYDTLTGIYSKKKFFEETHALLMDNPDDKFTFIRFDIDRFHLINSYFGMETGDEMLKYIGRNLSVYAARYEKSAYGRIDGDIFGICIPTQNRDEILDAVHQCSRILKSFSINFDMVPAFGIYEITDSNTPVDTIFDRANLAVKSCKGSYFSNYAFYDEEMGKRIEQEQEIVNDMNAAIKENQFHVWYQTKYDIRTNRPAGAEALVRWIHPEKGMISPGKFIPIFEHNGFISKLDSYVWERVCKDLRRWIDEGKTPHPISVNVSRVDLSNPKLVSHILGITEKYGIPHNLLNLELTESAYTDNPEKTIQIMKELKDAGFIILMDDFGSGYSSLSVLKDIDVSVLKIDMRFFSKSAVEGRGKSIIASVIRMAKWLKIPVIAEGVETKEQVEFLKSLGCEYVQGFYFAKPMPVEDYEKYLDSEEVYAESKDESSFDIANIWDNDFIVSNIMQPVAIIEYEQGNVEIIRVNNAYYDLFGYSENKDDFLSPTKNVNDLDMEGVMRAMYEVVTTGEGRSVDYRRKMPGGEAWINIKLSYINKADGKDIIYGIFSDVTAQKRLDDELMTYRKAMETETSSFSRIMIIDDAEINRDVLKMMFIDDYSVIEADNGRDALEKLKELKGQVDAILLDIVMPVMDGSEFLGVLRSYPELEAIPVIIITADSSEEQRKSIIAMGANDVIYKPFIDDLVKLRVKNVVEYRHRKAETMKSIVSEATIK
ncbi:MAG: EAL domain-containing protein [Ruminiclostridium sp.]